MIGKVLDLKQVTKIYGTLYNENSISSLTTFYITVETIESETRYGLEVRLQDYLRIVVGDIIEFDTSKNNSELLRFKWCK